MSARAKAGLKTALVRAASLALVMASAALGCGSTPPRDVNYGTNLGADFRAPVVDAASDAAADGAGGRDGAATQAGTGGSAGDAAGSPAGSTGGQAGAADTGVTDLAGADGTAGAGL